MKKLITEVAVDFIASQMVEVYVEDDFDENDTNNNAKLQTLIVDPKTIRWIGGEV